MSLLHRRAEREEALKEEKFIAEFLEKRKREQIEIQENIKRRKEEIPINPS